jgi:hypothetical protein
MYQMCRFFFNHQHYKKVIFNFMTTRKDSCGSGGIGGSNLGKNEKWSEFIRPLRYQTLSKFYCGNKYETCTVGDTP